jgi:hypothetical protein
LNLHIFLTFGSDTECDMEMGMYYSVYISHDLFMHYIFFDVWVSCDVWVLRHRSMDSKIHPIFQPMEKLVTWKIKWYRICQCLVSYIDMVALLHIQQYIVNTASSKVPTAFESQNWNSYVMSNKSLKLEKKYQDPYYHIYKSRSHLSLPRVCELLQMSLKI